MHPVPKAHAKAREKLIAAAAATSHFAPHPQQAPSRRAAPEQDLRQPREGERPLLRTIGPRHPGRRRRRPNAGSGASRPASATLCRGDPAVRRRTARLPRASVRRDEPPRLPPWLRRRPSRRARRDRSRVRGLTDISRPRVRLSNPRLPFPRRHHRHGRRRQHGTSRDQRGPAHRGAPRRAPRPCPARSAPPLRCTPRSCPGRAPQSRSPALPPAHRCARPSSSTARSTSSLPRSRAGRPSRESGPTSRAARRAAISFIVGRY